MRSDICSETGQPTAILKKYSFLPLMHSISGISWLRGHRVKVGRSRKMMCIETMNNADWDVLLKLREELKNNLMAYDAETQEKFVKLFVESLEGKGDRPVRAVSPTFPNDFLSKTELS